MTKPRIDLTGQTFGRLLVLRQAEDQIRPSGEHLTCWWCKCSCGKELSVVGKHLRKGSTRSCGCLAKEELIARNKKGIKHNIYDLSGEYGICYTEDKSSFWYFDKEDYEIIKQYYWHNVQGYAQSGDKETKRVVRMHRLILGLGKCDVGDSVVDHINGVVYDNRKVNLRICTRSQNMFNQKRRSSNTSGVTGVYYRNRDRMWKATIGVKGKSICLGCFSNIDDAVKARKEAEEKYFGEFSYDNSRKKGAS